MRVIGGYDDKKRWPEELEAFIRHHRSKNPATPFNELSKLILRKFGDARSSRVLSKFCVYKKIVAPAIDTRNAPSIFIKTGGDQIPSDLAKDILNLGNDTCRFPVVQNGREVFCKCKTLHRESYCEKHFVVVYPKRIKR